MVKKFELILLAILLLIIGFFTLNWAVKGAIHYQKDVQVPDLLNKSVLEAIDLLSKQNLGLKKDKEQFDDTVPAGTVIRQQPLPGSLVREGKIVRVIISQGSETVFVPELVGQSLRSAEIALRTNSLSLGEVRTQPSVKYEKDVVVIQTPDARKIVPRNSLVHLAISAGPPQDGTILMPDFVGKNRDQVENWANETGVEVQLSEDPTAPQEAGTVTQQSLPADSPVIKETPIKFVIATGNGTGTAGNPPPLHFNFEVPQSESAKQYTLILVEARTAKEIYRGTPQPGSKIRIPLPAQTSPSAKVRVLVNGILTEEKSIQ